MAKPTSPTLLLVALALFITSAGVFTYVLLTRQPTGPRTPQPAPESTEKPATAAKTYTLRGKIEQLPDPAVKGSMLHIHHEAIVGWVNRKGEAVGMNEMIMPFPPAEGVSLKGLNVGDLVEFKVEFDYSRLPPQRTTAISKLPPDTVLQIENEK